MQIFCSRSAFECFKSKVQVLRYYCGPATPFAGSEDVSGLVLRRFRETPFAGSEMSAVGAAAPHGLTPYSSLVEVQLRSAIQRPDRFPDQAFLQTN